MKNKRDFTVRLTAPQYDALCAAAEAYRAMAEGADDTRLYSPREHKRLASAMDRICTAYLSAQEAPNAQ